MPTARQLLAITASTSTVSVRNWLAPHLPRPKVLCGSGCHELPRQSARGGWHNTAMCGRYDLIDSPQMMMLYFMLDMITEPYSNADVRPTNMAPIIRVRDGQRLALPARWGLIPS